MKKQLLLLSFLVLSAAGVMAQSMSIQPTSTTFTGPTSNPLDAYITVDNVSNSMLPLMIERTIVNTMPDHLELFCSGSLCYTTGTQFTTTPDSIQVGGSTVLHATVFSQGQSGTTTLRYRFFSNDNVNDSASITLNFDFTTVGLNSVKNNPVLSAPSPNPADAFTVLNYNIQNSVANDRLVVYNMLGAMVKAVDVPGSTGVIVLNTAELRSGVYFVSYQQNGKLSGTTKLVVSHR